MEDNLDNLSKFGQQYQTKVLSNLIFDGSFLERVSDVLYDKYFESDPNQWISNSILTYYNTYKSAPTIDYFKSELQKITDQTLQKNVINQLKEVYSKQGSPDSEWVKSEFVTFCKNQNFKSVILKSVDLLKAGQFDRIEDLVRDAMKVGQIYDIGIDYTTDVALRFEDSNRKTVKTNWDVIDDLMDGGLGPGELGVIAAPSGVGKTWILSHIGAEAIKQGKNVLHYTLELTENYVGQRYDTIFTHIPSHELRDNQDKIKDRLDKLTGGMIIKYYPPKGITVNTIASHIELIKSTKWQPDLIIIDYADLLASKNQKATSEYADQGGVYIDLRGMGGELGIPIWTATQTNRCFSLDTEVVTSNGKIQIGKLREGDDILTHEGYKTVSRVYPIQTQPVYEITLKSGKKVKCSLRHEFPVKYGKLKSIESGLKVGDKLFTKKI